MQEDRLLVLFLSQINFPNKINIYTRHRLSRHLLPGIVSLCLSHCHRNEGEMAFIVELSRNVESAARDWRSLDNRPGVLSWAWVLRVGAKSSPGGYYQRVGGQGAQCYRQAHPRADWMGLDGRQGNGQVPDDGTPDGGFAALKHGYRRRGRCFLCSNGMIMSDIRKGKGEILLERQIACAVLSLENRDAMTQGIYCTILGNCSHLGIWVSLSLCLCYFQY